MTKLLITAAALALLATAADAACPTYLTDTGTSGADGCDVLNGRDGRPTRLRGGGGKDRFCVQNPRIVDPCPADNSSWDEILDYVAGEVIDAPDEQRIDRLTRIIGTSRCYVYWAGNNYVILRNCPPSLRKADVVVR